MVDYQLRPQASKAVQRYRDGRITNDEFESEYPSWAGVTDNAIRAISTMIWNYYGDNDSSPFQDQSYLPAYQLLTRCIQFLNSDYEYVWPESDFTRYTKTWTMLNRLTGGYFSRNEDREYREFIVKMQAVGDLHVWPFLHVKDYQVVSGEEHMEQLIWWPKPEDT